MAIVNMTKTCKENGITSFSRTRGGWMKQVEGLDKQYSNGYSFVGSNFIKVGNFNSNIMNGLYLDQSTSLVDDKKVFTMNLFKIINGEVELLKTTPKTNGWALELWDEVENYFKTESITAQEIVNMIREMTSNKSIIDEVVDILTFDAKEKPLYEFKNWHEVKSYLTHMRCFPTHINYLEEVLDDKNHHYYPEYVFKCKAISGQFRRIMTAQMNILYNDKITEETFIDFKSMKPNTIRKEPFQKAMELYSPHFLVTTLPNATGYHNQVCVYIYYKDDDVVVIRSFSYYVDPQYGIDQIPNIVGDI